MASHGHSIRYFWGVGDRRRSSPQGLLRTLENLVSVMISTPEFPKNRPPSSPDPKIRAFQKSDVGLGTYLTKRKALQIPWGKGRGHGKLMIFSG